MHKRQLICLVATRQCVPAHFVFREAYQYYEVRLKKKHLVAILSDWVDYGILDPIVEDYTLQVLSGRCERLKRNLIGAK